MTTLTERLAIIITGQDVGAGATFKQVGASSQQAASDMSVAERATGSFSSALQGAGPIAVGVAADIAAIKIGDHLVQQFTGATEGVRQFQLISGSSAQDASKLVYAFRQLGVDSDTAGTAFFRLAHNVEGSQSQLGKFGVQVAKNKDGSVDLSNTVLNIADAMQKAGPGAEADAIAFAGFGRQAAALTPLLLQGRDGVKAFYDQAARSGQVFNQSDIDKGHQFTLEMKQVQEEMKGVELEAGRMLLPIAKSVADVAGPVLGFFDGVYNKIDGIEKHIPSWLRGAAFKDAGKSAADTAKQVDGLTGALTNQTTAAADAGKALDTFTKSITDVTSAHDSLTKAQQAVTTSQRDEQTAQRALNDLRAKGKVDADQVASADKGVASASKAVADAQKAESAAAQQVADAQQGVLDAETALEKVRQGADPEDIAKAELSASKAQRDRQRATLALQDAIDKQGQAQSNQVIGVTSGTDADRAQEQAALDLADATDGVKEADFAAKDAQDALTKVRNQGKDGSDDLKKAQADLAKAQDTVTAAVDAQATAHQNVIDKQQAQIDAGTALAKAEAGDPDWDQKLADAQQKVADAHQNTVDQINAESDAVDQLTQKQKDLVAAQVAAATANTNVQTAAIGSQDFKPVQQSIGATTSITYNTIHTGADPNAVVAAQKQYAASNGGKPR